MTGKLGELVNRHDLVRVKLEKLLAIEVDLTLESIAELDHSLETLFQKIMSMELSEESEKLMRIRFAIAEITAICENGMLAKTLTDCIYFDARDLASDPCSSDSSLTDNIHKSSI